MVSPIHFVFEKWLVIILPCQARVYRKAFGKFAFWRFYCFYCFHLCQNYDYLRFTRKAPYITFFWKNSHSCPAVSPSMTKSFWIDSKLFEIPILYSLVRASELPVAVMVTSGKKSVKAYRVAATVANTLWSLVHSKSRRQPTIRCGLWMLFFTS